MNDELTKLLQESREEFNKDFVCDTDPEEHPFVAFYDEEENKFEFWNAYKIQKFIDEQIEKAYEKGKEDGQRIGRRNVILGVVEFFDDLEYKDYGVPDDSWRAYKFIRNNIRDWAKKHGILPENE